jgi:hypothetical protein
LKLLEVEEIQRERNETKLMKHEDILGRLHRKQELLAIKKSSKDIDLTFAASIPVDRSYTKFQHKDFHERIQNFVRKLGPLKLNDVTTRKSVDDKSDNNTETSRSILHIDEWKEAWIEKDLVGDKRSSIPDEEIMSAFLSLQVKI